MMGPEGVLEFRWLNDKPGETLNSKKYINLLEKAVKPYEKFHKKGTRNQWIFVQDQCRIHTSSETKDFLEKSQINCLNLPPKSPDLNPIE
jgi:transposase